MHPVRIYQSLYQCQILINRIVTRWIIKILELVYFFVSAVLVVNVVDIQVWFLCMCVPWTQRAFDVCTMFATKAKSCLRLKAFSETPAVTKSVHLVYFHAYKTLIITYNNWKIKGKSGNIHVTMYSPQTLMIIPLFHF